MMNLLETESRSSLLQRLDLLKPDLTPLWGSLTTAGMLAHMNDAVKICLGMKSVKVKGGFIGKVIMKGMVFHVLPRFPKNVNTAPEMDQKREGTPARDFYTEHAFLHQMIDLFLEREPQKMKPHPLFGDLTKEEWGILLAKHLDHHLRQFGV